ncbi:MAG: inorganic phosphate transporter [Deltaproteobacteria bacterium]|nr:inorganic phosphate transporter [Deltaproteobacteria bacterium]
MWQIISGIYMGWALGSNDAANVFGTAVSSRMLRFWTAASLCAVFALIGALVEGGAGMKTYSALSSTSLDTAFLVGLGAALTVTGMTSLRLPVSTSQAVVGALIAIGTAPVLVGTATTANVQLDVLGKVVACWVGTPIGALVAAVVLYVVIGQLMNRLALNVFQYDRLLRMAQIVAGSYGAYALGANNVANVTGPFTGPGMLSVPAACLVGGLAIAAGSLTFSRGVMMTVGRGLVKLDAYSAFIVILAEGVTVHAYAVLGVPVSTSQAVVGGVLGIGIVKGARTVNRRTLRNILLAWISTPTVSFLVTLAGYVVAHEVGWL